MALVTALLAVAAEVATGHPLPAAVERVRQRLQAALDTLAATLRDKPKIVDNQRAQRADRAEDAAWSALLSWLTGWARLPGNPPQAAQAAAIVQVIFPDALKFTKLAFRLEWAEADAKLARLAKDGFDKAIAALGGQPFLDALAATHKEYGEAQGVTGEAAAGGESTSVRVPFDAVIDQLRRYVLQVAAIADEEDPATLELVERLLRPLDEWKLSHAIAKPAAPAPNPA